jgi:hypothetical protein
VVVVVDQILLIKELVVVEQVVCIMPHLNHLQQLVMQ